MVEKNEIRNRILLVAASILFSLILAEMILQFFNPADLFSTQNTLNQKGFFPRYTINNQPRSSLDYFIQDNQLPFALKPGYNKTLSDQAFHPVPFKISLDEFGYRNIGVKRVRYDLVLVGDSVAFGFGVNNEDTIASHLNSLATTYNLAIPGAGPWMYLVMIDRFLKRATAGQIVILFYEGNDPLNLHYAYWEGLETCSNPGSARIFRKDTPIKPTSEEGAFSLKQLLNNAVGTLFPNQNLTSNELRYALKQLSGFAKTDLENFEQYESKIKENQPRALFYLQQLSKADCVPNAIKSKLEDVITEIKRGRHETLATQMAGITDSLAKIDCYPVGSDFEDATVTQNLITHSNHFGGYFYEFVASLKNGYWGNVQNLQVFLKELSSNSFFQEENNLISRFQKALDKNPTSQIVSEFTTKLEEAISKKTNLKKAPDSCDKANLFFDNLKTLTLRGNTIHVFSFPSEFQVNHASLKKGSNTCRMALSKGIPCTDLFPLVYERFQSPHGNSIYLDGAHLNKNGSSIVAKWIADELGLRK